MTEEEFKQKMEEFNRLMSVENREGDFNRARGIAVGTSFGGVTEISLRMNSGRSVWALLQPVEVVELIHQLAANVGCHINLQPRQDFSSWRRWNNTEEELLHYKMGGGALLEKGGGHPPHVNDLEPHKFVGANMAPPEQQPGLQPALMARSESNEQTVATQKTVGRKRTKRASAAT